MLRSSAATLGAIGLSRFSGINIIKAQASKYELVVIQKPEISIVDGATAYFGTFAAISNDGIIAGSLAVSEVKVSPVSWSIDGTRTKLKSGEFGGRATCVADAGVIGGTGYPTRLGYPEVGFGGETLPRIWVNEEVVELLLPVDAASEYGRILRVNSSGTAVGITYRTSEFSDDGTSVVTVFADGTATTLYDGTKDLLDPFTNQIFLSSSGTVVGIADQQVEWSSGDGSSGTFWVDQIGLYKDGVMTTLERPTDFPVASDPEDGARFSSPAIVGVTAEDHVVVNYSSTASGITDSRSFLYAGTAPTELESGDTSLPYVSTSLVSSSGLILGAAFSEDRRTTERVIWDGDTPTLVGEIVNESGLTIGTITGINDDGVMCAHASDEEGAWHGVIISPI